MNTVEYKKKLKRNDIGNIFRISFDSNPPEFNFESGLTCEFHAKNIEDENIKFSGACSVDMINKKAFYSTKAGDLAEEGIYEFEFEFKINDIVQTYPKSETLKFRIVEDFD